MFDQPDPSQFGGHPVPPSRPSPNPAAPKAGGSTLPLPSNSRIGRHLLPSDTAIYGGQIPVSA